MIPGAYMPTSTERDHLKYILISKNKQYISKLNHNQTYYKNRTILHLAAKYDVVHLLPEETKCLNIEAKDSDLYTPLQIAVLGGNIKAVSKLIEDYNANIHILTDDCKKTLLHLAAQNNCPQMLIKYLVDRGLELQAIDVDGDTPLDYANFSTSRIEAKKTIELLIQQEKELESKCFRPKNSKTSNR